MILTYQMGGEMAPQPQGGGEDMGAQLQEMAGAIIQELGPEGAAALAQMIMELVQGGAEMAEEQVAYDKKGKKIMKAKKCASGNKMKGKC